MRRNIQAPSNLLLVTLRNTHIKVVPSVFQDELGGVWFVLTVVDIHLELVSLKEERNTEYLTACESGQNQY